jgi:hypothetical protein
VVSFFVVKDDTKGLIIAIVLMVCAIGLVSVGYRGGYAAGQREERTSAAEAGAGHYVVTNTAFNSTEWQWITNK